MKDLSFSVYPKLGWDSIFTCIYISVFQTLGQVQHEYSAQKHGPDHDSPAKNGVGVPAHSQESPAGPVTSPAGLQSGKPAAGSRNYCSEGADGQ